MPCKMCIEREKTWSGDDPKCAFDTGEFSPDNWNCATVNAIRDICYEGGEIPQGVDYRYFGDQKYATILTHTITDLDDVDCGYCLWITWYKNRGKTDQMLVLDYRGAWYVTEEQCLEIIRYYHDRSRKNPEI